MTQNIIGRNVEKHILLDRLHSSDSEFIVVYGRRRIGKTYLIEQVYDQNIRFHLAGEKNADNDQHLALFCKQFKKYTKQVVTAKNKPTTWIEAFELLEIFFTKKKSVKKMVFFFDEIAWLAKDNSDFMIAFSQFWNSWANKRKDIILIVCSSNASWMVKRLIQDKGSLYKRVTQNIRLQQFTLAETELFLKSRKINFLRYQILQLYMVFGGVAFYLKQLRKDFSVEQNIQHLCFVKDALLKDEYEILLESIFDYKINHRLFMDTLAANPSGLSYPELLRKAKVPSGGSASVVLEELTQSGFVKFHVPYQKLKRDGIYRMVDEYCLFHHKFMKAKSGMSLSWRNITQTNSFKIWAGFAFEAICLKDIHMPAIAKALGISDVSYATNSWYVPAKNKAEGFQIDMLIDRMDKVINVCEIKFTEGKFIMTKNYAAQLKSKIEKFKSTLKNKKYIITTIISVNGIQPNIYTKSLVERSLEIEELFI